jgi:hypothetical protein
MSKKFKGEKNFSLQNLQNGKEKLIVEKKINEVEKYGVYTTAQSDVYENPNIQVLTKGKPFLTNKKEGEYEPSQEVLAYLKDSQELKQNEERLRKIAEIKKSLSENDSIKKVDELKPFRSTSDITNPEYTTLKPETFAGGMITLTGLNKLSNKKEVKKKIGQISKEKKEGKEGRKSVDKDFEIGQKFTDENGTVQTIVNRDTYGDVYILSDGKNESKETKQSLASLIEKGEFKIIGKLNRSPSNKSDSIILPKTKLEKILALKKYIKQNKDKNPTGFFANPEGIHKKLNELGWSKDFVDKYLDKVDIKQIIQVKRMFNEADREYFENKAKNPETILDAETVELEKQLAQLQQELQEIDTQEQHDLAEIEKQKQLITELEAKVEKEKTGAETPKDTTTSLNEKIEAWKVYDKLLSEAFRKINEVFSELAITKIKFKEKKIDEKELETIQKKYDLVTKEFENIKINSEKIINDILQNKYKQNLGEYIDYEDVK